MFAIPPVESALAHYQATLACWEAEITSEGSLAVLIARDTLQKALEAESEVSVITLRQLVDLDGKLQENASRISQSLDLAGYRHSLAISPQFWWWNLDALVEDDSPEGLSWLWKGVRIGVWTVNLGLLGTLATRFFSGATGLVEMLAIALPSILALLQANSELTKSGQEGFNRLFNKLKIAPNLYEQAKFIPTASIFFVLLIIWFLQPQFSRQINQEGLQAQERGQLTSAEQHYLKAIALNPDNLDATYNLGNLYEELQNFDNAKKYYVIAAKGGIADAYNNLARLYIRQNQYSEAILLLNDGLAIVENQEQKTEALSQDLNGVKYSLFKNLGWAKLLQGEALGRVDKLKQIDYTEAKSYLLVAIGIASDPAVKSSLLNPGAAHCLLAKILDVEGSPESLEQWRQCYDLVGKRLGARDVRNPEDEAWFALAKQKLTLAGEVPP